MPLKHGVDMEVRRGDVAVARAGGAGTAVRLLVLHARVADLSGSGRREDLQAAAPTDSGARRQQPTSGDSRR